MKIARLPEVEDLPWGQELKARWTEEGRAQGRAEVGLESHMAELQAMATFYDQLRASGDLTSAAYEQLMATLTPQLQRVEAKLAALRSSWMPLQKSE